MAFTASDVPDLVKGTLYRLGRMKFQQIAQSLVRYEIFTKWFKEDKVVVGDGLGLQRNMMTRHATTARHVGWNDPDRVAMASVLEQLKVEWVQLTDAWGFDYRETLMNKGASQIVDIIKARRASTMLSIASELETKAWSAPSASNTVDPKGIPHWLVKSATTGFNGGYPSGYTTIGGLNLETQAPTFKNYTFAYSAFNKTSLVKPWRTAMRVTDFVSPVSIDDYRGEVGRQFRHYVNEATLSNIEDIGEAQNENLGRDLSTMDGKMTFNSNPIIYVPQLDSDTQNPIYSIDHSTFYPIVLQGMFLLEHDAIRAPENHNRYYIPVDLMYNYICIDRRRNTVSYYNGS
jgi:hypothetical protein